MSLNEHEKNHLGLIFILLGNILLNENGLFQHCSYNLNSAILQLKQNNNRGAI